MRVSPAFLGCILLPVIASAATDIELANRLASRIDDFHAETRRATTLPLRIVYFHPADAPPQSGYQERLQRILTDIRDFYEVEIKRLGFGSRPIPLETSSEGAIVMHRVQGKQPNKSYRYDQQTGKRILDESREALKGTIDFDREFVLVICSLCDKLGDGSYSFHSPYFGWGGSNHRWGLCFAADCERLDTLHYADEETRFRYREHLGKFEKTLGAFNRLYIGGLAHELGHGLGLPHNAEKPAQKRAMGTALMGSGNHTWREETIGRKGSFLTLASGVRLLCHPLLTQSDRARFEDAQSTVKDLSFRPTQGEGFSLIGEVASSPPAFAAIVDTDPDGRSNYDSHTWVAEVSRDGHFAVPVGLIRKGEQEIRLTFCHLNGATTQPLRIPFNAKARGDAPLTYLQDAWNWREAELAFMKGEMERVREVAQREPASPTPLAERLVHLAELSDGPAKPLDLETMQSSSAPLSDAIWKSAKVGWGRPGRNAYHLGSGGQEGVCLIIGDRFHRKGLYAHAPSSYQFEIGSDWTHFTAEVGLQKGAPEGGSSVFVVVGDGVELHRSSLLKPGDSKSIRVELNQVRTLELIVESGKDDNRYCWSVWGSPTLHR